MTVGWERGLVERLWGGVTPSSSTLVSHILHPRRTRHDWKDTPPASGFYFFRRELRERMPGPDRQLLASLEQDGLPTIHNMILGDRVVSKLAEDDALAYATFLARRLFELFEELKPSVIIGGYDAIHAGLAHAVARHMQIPWFALHFCVIPPGMACFCNRQSPAARVQLSAVRDPGELRAFAQASLERFEGRNIKVHAYIAPPPLSLVEQVRKLPARMSALIRTMQDARQRGFLRFTDSPGRYSVAAAISRLRHTTAARKVVSTVDALETPPAGNYVLFALHTQPESSIDVWAPFFSNQMWVIELLSRSIPPSHKLLVKVHKSDVLNYSDEQLARMRLFPGVVVVRPFADTRSFIEKASLVVAIQGTIGLESALLGKPVIMLGESPVSVFPNASRIGNITDLPALIRTKLEERPPQREEIIEAYAAYLAPFLPASHNAWSAEGGSDEHDRYARLFAALRQYVTDRSPSRHRIIA